MIETSVIIPTYNSAKHLKAAIDSVLAQTYTDFEIIIVDDGSKDDTSVVVKTYQMGYPDKIRYIYQENQGPAPARNNGFKNCRGRYIAFLDADDVWLNTKLKKQLSYLHAHAEIGFVYCDNFFVDKDGNEIKNYVRKVKLTEGDILLTLFNDFFIITSGVVLKKDCVDAIGMFDEHLLVGEDYEYFLRLAKSFKAGVIQEKLFNRRVHPDSLSRQDYVLDAKNDIDTLKKFLNDNPNFYKSNKSSVRTRLGDYYFTFAYSLLEEGKNFIAFKQLFFALKYERSFRIFKNIILCFLPFQIRKFLK